MFKALTMGFLFLSLSPNFSFGAHAECVAHLKKDVAPIVKGYFKDHSDRLDSDIEESLEHAAQSLGKESSSDRLESLIEDEERLSDSEWLFQYFAQFKIKEVFPGSKPEFLDFLMVQYFQSQKTTDSNMKTDLMRIADQLMAGIIKLHEMKMVVINKNSEFDSSSRPTSRMISKEEFSQYPLSDVETLSPEHLDFNLDGYMINEHLGLMVEFLKSHLKYDSTAARWIDPD